MILHVAVIEVAFDPLIRLGDLTVSWQQLGVALALLLALGAAALIGGRHALPARLDDLAYIALAVVPGAVVGGRLVHAIVFWPAYADDPWRLADPNLGSLSLLGAVLGGCITGGYVAHLLGGPGRHWATAAAPPLLLALGLGKAAQFLGGSGQGLPFDGSWAVAFIGPGPWVSAAPEMPSHPAQLYEALWLLLGAVILMRPSSGTPDLDPDERRPLFSIALGWFLLGRLIVGFTWRDERVLAGALNAEQALALLALVLLVGLALAVQAVARYRQRRLSMAAEYGDDMHETRNER